MLNIKLKSDVFIKQYGESQRTPPIEETSLHQWNSSVERPRGSLSLFVTSLRVQVKSHFVSRIVFLMVNHCGCLPLRELALHQWNTGVGRPWGILSLFTITCEFTSQSQRHVTFKCMCVSMCVCMCVCVWETNSKMKKINITEWCYCPKQRQMSHHRFHKVTADLQQ